MIGGFQVRLGLKHVMEPEPTGRVTQVRLGLKLS